MEKKDIYEQLALKFSYLSNLKPAGIKQKFTLFDNILSDSFVHDFNPSRYRFYQELMKAFQKPNVLKNVIYENKLIKSKQEELEEIYQQIMNKFQALYRLDKTELDELKGKTGEDDYAEAYNTMKNEKIVHANEQVANNIIKAIKSYYKSSEQTRTMEAENIVRETLNVLNVAAPSATNNSNVAAPVAAPAATGNVAPKSSNKKSGGGAEESKLEENIQKISGFLASDTTLQNNLQDFDPKGYTEKKKKVLENLEKSREEFYNKSKLMGYKNRLEEANKTEVNDEVKAKMLKDILGEFDEDPEYSIKKFNLTKEDKLVFIFVTFMIRLITLMIIDWSLTSNFIVNFYQAYFLYIGLYCIFLLLIIVIVNMSYSSQLVPTDNSFAVNLASSMYFFYFVPGKMWSSSLRILVHFGVIIFMTLVSLFIVYNPKTVEGTLNYNYSEKKYIKKQLNNFTLILWLFTSFLALSFKVS